jgi:hypothetical protein
MTLRIHGDTMLTYTLLGHLCRQLFLRYGHLPAKAGHPGALLQTPAQHDAMVAKSSLYCDWIHSGRHGDDLFLGYLLVWCRCVGELVP